MSFRPRWRVGPLGVQPFLAPAIRSTVLPGAPESPGAPRWEAGSYPREAASTSAPLTAI